VLRGSISKGYVVVNRRSERVFLYGRDVLPEGIVEIKPSNCGGMLVVLSEDREPLGWGRVVKRRRIVKNIIDLGWYLRSGI
jgi:60S ribosome subunit biogenesis protein NIP7